MEHAGLEPAFLVNFCRNGKEIVRHLIYANAERYLRKCKTAFAQMNCLSKFGHFFFVNAVFKLSWRGLQRLRCRNQGCRMCDQLLDEAQRDIELALVFGQVAFGVGLVEQQPLLRREPQRMLQALKHQIAVFAAVAVGSQGRQCRRMRGVIGQVKAAFQGKRRLSRILQEHGGRAQQAGALARIRRLGFKLADARQVRQMG